VTLLGSIQSASARTPEPPDAASESGALGDWHWKARRVLTRFGARTVPALIEALSAESDPAIRQFAADSLARLGHEAAGVEDALHHAARRDPSPKVRAAAGAALEAIREAAEKARLG
jgi:HEAT repeat protein